MGPTELTLEASAMITSSGAGTSGTIANLTPSQKRRAASDLTATMQLIYSIAPALYKRSESADFPAPVTDTLTATDGSTTVTTSYAFGEGCSVFVGGILNEIYTEAGVKKLRFPYAGASGAQSAVFYGDCVVLDSSIAKVTGPVALPRNGNQNSQASTRADGFSLRKFNNRSEAEQSGWRRRTGIPEWYWVEPFLIASQPAGPSSISVTGSITPSAIGSYPFIGTDPNGNATYAQGGWFVFFNSITWYITKDPLYVGSGYNWHAFELEGSYTAGAFYTGSPTVALVPATTPTGQQSTLRLRVAPLPSQRVQAGFDVILRAPKFTVADLGTDDVPSTANLVVAEDYHEMLVRPIFLKMWAGSAWFRGPKELRNEIDQNDKAARSFLREYRPQQESNRQIYPMSEGNGNSRWRTGTSRGLRY